MFRKLDRKIEEWADRKNRHPLVLRGARQVGKTYLVRALAKRRFKTYLELNFEQDETLSTLFASKRPDQICELLSVRFEQKIIDGETLVFLDELQAADVCVMESLRYFYEQRPSLHIVAAGSLLEFMLDGKERARRKCDFPMPVGRIEYMFVPPLDFEEFLTAIGKHGFVEWLGRYELGTDVPQAIHQELTEALRKYLVVGGMPAAVSAYVEGGAIDAEREQQLIVSTYHDDFPKYSRTVRPDLLQKTFMAIPSMLGRKLIYTHLVENEKSKDISAAFSLLRLARVVAKVRHAPANGIPLAYGADERNFKPLFLDTGLVCRILGLKLVDFLDAGDALLENRGGLCEQFVGQHLLFVGETYEEPAAYCWMREEPSSTAEVDYVVQCGNAIVPVEVKSGASGRMKGLQIFLNEKERDFAVRFNADMPSFIPDAVAKDPKGRECRYALLSLPLYMVGQLDRLVRLSLAHRDLRVKP
jgi:uncharacterized protein